MTTKMYELNEFPFDLEIQCNKKCSIGIKKNQINCKTKIKISSIENKEEKNNSIESAIKQFKNKQHLFNHVLIILIDVTFVEMSLLAHCLTDIAPKVLS